VPTRVSVDINPAGLDGLGVCADGRRLPFADGAFDLLTAFDVVEHFEDEAGILLELARVVRGGGQIGIAVPAYEWAWSPFDVAQGHHRRYTRPRLVAALEAASLEVVRCTHGFAGTFPFFAAVRLRDRLRGGAPDDTLPEVGGSIDALMRRLGRIDERLLATRDLPFGSSIFALARKAQ
jgi:SAM-dependent methyltransferase